MLNRIAPKVFLLVLTGCLISCDLSLTREESVVVPTTDGPTVTAFLCPQDTVHRVRLRYTVPAIGPVDETGFREDLNKTVVELSQGGRTAALVFDAIYQVFSVRASQFTFKAGDNVSLRVQMPNRRVVEASCTIPISRVDSSSIRLEKNVLPSGAEFYRGRWLDIPGEPNYYAFWILRTDYDVRSGEYTIQQELSRLPLDDRNLIDGELVTDPFSFILPRRDSPNGSYEQTEVMVCNTDETYYTYHRILNQIQRDPSPFVESIRLPSNISNGYGAMAGYTRTSLVVK